MFPKEMFTLLRNVVTHLGVWTRWILGEAGAELHQKPKVHLHWGSPPNAHFCPKYGRGKQIFS